MLRYLPSTLLYTTLQKNLRNLCAKDFVFNLKNSSRNSTRIFSLINHNHGFNGLAFIHVFIGSIDLVQAIAMGEDTSWIDVAI